MNPAISIISGIYNCADTLPEAVESILAQTVTDWEWILCDDGSTDQTYEVAKAYADKHPQQFILLRNEKNRGLNHTLNRCLHHATGKYIARMDGDDRCSPQRFAEELRCLETHPELALVSTNMTLFDETGTWGYISHPEFPQNRDFLAGSPFCHAPCMMRREALEAVGGYTESKHLLRMEDYHLWIKLYAKGFRGKNIHQALYQMRDDSNATRRRTLRCRWNEAYVRLLMVKELKLPFYTAVYALRPLLIALLPQKLYDLLRRRNLRR